MKETQIAKYTHLVTNTGNAAYWVENINPREWIIGYILLKHHIQNVYVFVLYSISSKNDIEWLRRIYRYSSAIGNDLDYQHHQR